MNKIKLIYYGHSMFGVKSTTGTEIITDPYNEKIKSKLPDVSGDIVISSHDHFDHNNISLVKGNPRVVNEPVKIELKNIKIEGISSYHDKKKGKLRGKNTIFKFSVDGIIFSHLGDLGHIPDKDTLNRLSDVDILLIPVGGIYTVDAREAAKITKIIKPAVVIPMHYKEEDSKLEVDKVESFTNIWGKYEKIGHSIDLSKDKLPEPTEVWVMDSR